MKFCTHHFPVGTVFRINQDVVDYKLRDQEGSDVRAVTSIVQNGVRSWVLMTGVMREHAGEEGFNISHVKEVLSRGDGPVVIDYLYYCPVSSAQRERFAEDVEKCEIRDLLKPKKGYYTTLSLSAVIRWELTKFIQPGQQVAFDAAVEAVLQQTWVVKSQLDWFCALRVCKKRLRKFLKANINRFLIDLDAAAKAESEEMNRQYEQAFEDMEDILAGYRRMSTQDHKVFSDTMALLKSNEGSCYDEADNPDDAADYMDDDPNMYLPTEFVTNFDVEQRPLYEESIKRASVHYSDGELEIQDRDPAHGHLTTCSLWYYPRSGTRCLSRFWRIFDQVQAEMKAASSAAQQLAQSEGQSDGN